METLRQQGSVSVVDLANQLKVSSVTIRKDLTLLEEKEMLYRTHGSAILINPYIIPIPQRYNIIICCVLIAACTPFERSTAIFITFAKG